MTDTNSLYQQTAEVYNVATQLNFLLDQAKAAMLVIQQRAIATGTVTGKNVDERTAAFELAYPKTNAFVRVLEAMKTAAQTRASLMRSYTEAVANGTKPEYVTASQILSPASFAVDNNTQTMLSLIDAVNAMCINANIPTYAPSQMAAITTGTMAELTQDQIGYTIDPETGELV